LAREWGISDVGLAKICKRNNISRPGLGYWAKRQAGIKVKQILLPKEDHDLANQVRTLHFQKCEKQCKITTEI
jgi:hypothetical protein